MSDQRSLWPRIQSQWLKGDAQGRMKTGWPESNASPQSTLNNLWLGELRIWEHLLLKIMEEKSLLILIVSRHPHHVARRPQFNCASSFSLNLTRFFFLFFFIKGDNRHLKKKRLFSISPSSSCLLKFIITYIISKAPQSYQ